MKFVSLKGTYFCKSKKSLHFTGIYLQGHYHFCENLLSQMMNSKQISKFSMREFSFILNTKIITRL